LTGPIQLEPIRVQLIGERRTVRSIDTVATTAIDLVVRDTTPMTVALDTTGLGVRVNPAFVRVRVPIVAVEPSAAAASASTRRRQ
jgi:hypothetical protein